MPIIKTDLELFSVSGNEVLLLRYSELWQNYTFYTFYGIIVV